MIEHKRRVSRSAAGRSRRGVALLEVVVSVSILLLAMGVVGLTFHNGTHNVQLADRMTRAAMFTERLLAELEAGILLMDQQDQSGWCGIEGPEGMSWRVTINPDLTMPGIMKVDVYVYMGDPEGPEDQRQTVLETHVLRAQPQGLNFQRDFGFDEEQVLQLTDAIPGGAAIMDPTNFDPRDLARMDLDTLASILPELLKAFGLNLNSAQLAQIMNMARSGNMQAFENVARQLEGTLREGGGAGALGEALEGMDRPRRGGDGNGSGEGGDGGGRRGGGRRSDGGGRDRMGGGEPAESGFGPPPEGDTGGRRRGGGRRGGSGG